MSAVAHLPAIDETLTKSWSRSGGSLGHELVSCLNKKPLETSRRVSRDVEFLILKHALICKALREPKKWRKKANNGSGGRREHQCIWIRHRKVCIRDFSWLGVAMKILAILKVIGHRFNSGKLELWSLQAQSYTERTLRKIHTVDNSQFICERNQKVI